MPGDLPASVFNRRPDIVSGFVLKAALDILIGIDANILTTLIFVLDEKFGRYFLEILDNVGAHVFVTFQVVFLDGPAMTEKDFHCARKSINKLSL